MDIEDRLRNAEDAIRTLNLKRVQAEGRSFAFERALLGLLDVAAPLPNVFEAVEKSLHIGTTVALNSTEPQQKVDATEVATQEILAAVTAAVERAQRGS